jgi:EAL domain-containing protein (putative c-di-GMP-specific phosphodiesterase class I)
MQIPGRKALAPDLARALRDQQFLLAYQPLFRLRSGEIAGFEALMRWRHPRYGLILPSHFIPLAEELGLIAAMGLWALREACDLLAKLPRHLRIAVNVSPLQLMGKRLIDEVAPLIERASIAPDRLELEITETSLLARDRRTQSCLHELRALGLRISMDDFGTGYSSLSSLMQLPFDTIKIDQTFVSALGHCAGSAAVVRAVVEMAAGLGMSTTAEGVETEEQLEYLRSVGCSEGQGYLWSGPLTVEDVLGGYGIPGEGRAVACAPAGL